MGEKTSLGITASKVVSLVGILVLIREAVILFQKTDLGSILFGVLWAVFAALIFFSLNIINLPKFKIPYRWIILLVIGAVLLVLAIFFTKTYLSATLILIAFLLELLSEKKTYVESKIVVLIGACIAIYESIMLIISTDPSNVVAGIFGIIFAVIILLSLQQQVDVKVPYVWWIILISGFVIFTWVNFIGVAGTVIMVGFILILMAY
ncbi:MAG: hypothetical protein P8Y70_08885 [Candidatus Lokiarchaeota archaeon]